MTGTRQSKIDFARQKAAGQRYYQLWKALQQRGVMPVIVTKAEHPTLWQAWRDYYQDRAVGDPAADGRWPGREDGADARSCGLRTSDVHRGRA